MTLKFDVSVQKSLMTQLFGILGEQHIPLVRKLLTSWIYLPLRQKGAVSLAGSPKCHHLALHFSLDPYCRNVPSPVKEFSMA